MSIRAEGNKLNPDSYIELLEVDATHLGAGILFYTNSSKDPILWAGQTYNPFPYKLDNLSTKGDGTALARPTIEVSNVHKTFHTALLSLGNLVGVKMTRRRTFYKFTGNGTNPDTNAEYPPQEFIVSRKLTQTKTIIKLELASLLDRPSLKLPPRLILRDFGFPGVSRVRFRG